MPATSSRCWVVLSTLPATRSADLQSRDGTPAIATVEADPKAPLEPPAANITSHYRSSGRSPPSSSATGSWCSTAEIVAFDDEGEAELRGDREPHEPRLELAASSPDGRRPVTYMAFDVFYAMDEFLVSTPRIPNGGERLKELELTVELADTGVPPRRGGGAPRTRARRVD